MLYGSYAYAQSRHSPSKVSHELQVTDLSMSGNPSLQEVSCVLDLQS
jgi:hypothetical protein